MQIPFFKARQRLGLRQVSAREHRQLENHGPEVNDRTARNKGRRMFGYPSHRRASLRQGVPPRHPTTETNSRS